MRIEAWLLTLTTSKTEERHYGCDREKKGTRIGNYIPLRRPLQTSSSSGMPLRFRSKVTRSRFLRRPCLRASFWKVVVQAIVPWACGYFARRGKGIYMDHHTQKQLEGFSNPSCSRLQVLRTLKQPTAMFNSRLRSSLNPSYLH